MHVEIRCSSNRAFAARFRKKVNGIVERQNKDFAVTIVSTMTRFGDPDDRVHGDIEKVIVDRNFQCYFPDDTGLGFHATIDGNFIFALGEFLCIAYRVSRDANTGQRFG